MKNRLFLTTILVVASFIYYYGEVNFAQSVKLAELKNTAIAQSENGSGYPGWVPCVSVYSDPSWFVNDHDFIDCVTCKWARGHDLGGRDYCSKP
jgi:hypothetical protein